MKFPFITVDFEASSLNMESHPIEVGVAVAASISGPVEVWHSLIQPASAWQRDQRWSQTSQRVHGITQEMLVDGRDPLEVAQALNHIIGLTGHAWCDGGSYDAHWFKTLFRAAGIKPTFYLWDIAALFALDRPMRTRFYAMLAADDAPHRAGPDALRLCVALVRANGGQVGGGEGTTHQWRAM